MLEYFFGGVYLLYDDKIQTSSITITNHKSYTLVLDLKIEDIEKKYVHFLITGCAQYKSFEDLLN